MIYSMTAFARAEVKSERASIACELRSINHRYLEINIYLPESLRALEMPIREKLRTLLKRGKIECTIRYQPNESISTVAKINHVLAKTLCDAAEKISTFLQHPAPINATDILRFPGVLENAEIDLPSLQADVLQVVELAIQDLLAGRRREGEALTTLFLERMALLQDQITKIKERLPNIMQEQQTRLQKRFQDAHIELDPVRLEQEMVFFAQKTDISEEIDRAATHIEEVRRILKEGGIAGRRLDFLMQELNREANTLGSKSVDSATSYAAVEMKVIIEQVREQVQNVE